MPEAPKQEIKLFYCYACEDKALRDELEKHLNTLKRLYSLRNWHDRDEAFREVFKEITWSSKTYQCFECDDQYRWTNPG